MDRYDIAFSLVLAGLCAAMTGLVLALIGHVTWSLIASGVCFMLYVASLVISMERSKR